MMQRALHLFCQVCGDKGWVQAIPVTEVNPAAEVTIETSPRLAEHEAITVPCWACPATRLRVVS